MNFGASLTFCTGHRLRSGGLLLELKSSLRKYDTPLMVFLPDLEFSTITRFFPGLMRDAFQNSVPKSMPIT